MNKLMSHKEANYRISSSGEKRCGLCKMFRYGGNKPHSCTIVLPPIRSNFVCAYFELKEKEPPRAA